EADLHLHTSAGGVARDIGYAALPARNIHLSKRRRPKDAPRAKDQPAEDQRKAQQPSLWHGWTNRFLWPGILGLLLLVILAYLPAFQGDFVWDDEKAVRDNAMLRTTDGLRKIWTDPSANRYEAHYWPLVYSSFWLEYQLWGLAPAGYHATNIVTHAL